MIPDCGGLLGYFVCVSAENMLDYFISIFLFWGTFLVFFLKRGWSATYKRLRSVANSFIILPVLASSVFTNALKPQLCIRKMDLSLNFHASSSQKCNCCPGL